MRCLNEKEKLCDCLIIICKNKNKCFVYVGGVLTFARRSAFVIASARARARRVFVSLIFVCVCDCVSVCCVFFKVDLLLLVFEVFVLSVFCDVFVVAFASFVVGAFGGGVSERAYVFVSV